jgi:hypothetical protein
VAIPDDEFKGPNLSRLHTLSFLIVAFAAVMVPASGAAAKEPAKPAAGKAASDKAFQKVKREFQQKIRNKKPAERIAALKLLDEFPTGDAADLVYVTLLDDKSDEVRTAAVELLKAWRDREGVAARILQRMTTNTRKDPMDLRAMGGLRVLAGAEDDDLQRQVLGYLDEFLGTPHANQYLLHEMIDEQSPVGDTEEVLRMLALFTRAQFFDRHFGYRRCVMQGMMQVKSRDAISHLINQLPRLKGLVQFDVVTHLIKTTGQNFADDAAKWKAWWAQNQGAKDLPEKPKIPPPTNYGKFGEYYGIPICAKRIVFVLDTSGSMRAGRLDAAKVELIRAIKEIPREVSFSIVVFNSTVRVWQRELVPANESMKQIAVNVVLEQEARNDTATFDALEAAFELEPEAVYLLSDGAPQGGKIDNPVEIVGSVSTGNRVRRISIHSIGIDTQDAAVSPFARFMKALAESNWGEFRAVN